MLNALAPKYAPPARRVGDVVYSTGFHESLTNHWIAPGTEGKIVSTGSVTMVRFDDFLPEVAVMTSDVRPSLRSAMTIHDLYRPNFRWIENN